jgi:NAD(P)-dependent dehydrogenase (short-subunit alcohol dehydrogenase family)
MVLLQHGLFTWGETAEESYRAHIRLVQAAEDWIARQPNVTPGAWDDGRVAQAQRRVGRVAACLRGALVRGGLRVVLDARADGQTLALLADERLDGWVAAGPITPDHVIRTKPLACVARVPQDGDDEAIRVAIEDALERYRSHYLAYVQAHIAGRPLVALDPWPRVVLVPGVGLFGVGGAPGAAAIAADIGVRTLAVKATAAGVGGFVGLPASDLFEVEYWSLEQAKLGKSKPKPLEGKVAVITGGAGAIGVGIAGQLLAAGAVVALADQDALALARAEQAVGKSKSLMTVHVDVTSPSATAAAFDAVAARFGGIDIVVPNAGIAHVAPVLELDADAWNRVLDVNATGVFLTTREAARWLTLQGVGGDIVIISSKNVFGPGEGFGAYSASKAAAHQLGRVAALELAQHGIRVNMVNPDAVFAQGAIPSGLWAAVGPDRARVRGLRTEDLPAFYRERNLLRAEVTGAHVGAAVVFFASGVTPTTGAALPVDGGVATAFPR